MKSLWNNKTRWTYLGSNISSTESTLNIHKNTRPAIDRLSIIGKSDLPGEIKGDFSQTMAVSVLLYGCAI